ALACVTSILVTPYLALSAFPTRRSSDLTGDAGGMTASTATTAPHLSREEVDDFHRQGHVGPYTAVTPEAMAPLRARIESDVLPTTGRNPANPLQSRHLDHRLVHDLVTHPAVLGRIRSLSGGDI